MTIMSKQFKLANAALLTAMALAGCKDNLTQLPAENNPNPSPGNPPGEVVPLPGDHFVVFKDTQNAYWPTWDCCGGTTPTFPVELNEHGMVTEFTIGATPAVLGYVRAEAQGSLDISAYEAKGTLELDIKLVNAPVNGATTWHVKLESNGGTENGNNGEYAEVTIPTPISTWQNVTINISDLANQGLDLTSIDNILIFPAWDTGEGSVYRVDNVEFVIDGNDGGTPAPGPSPTPERPDADTGLKMDLTAPVTDFGGNTSVQGAADPAAAIMGLAAASNTSSIVATTKPSTAETWAGTTLGDLQRLDFSTERTHVSVWVYAPESGIPVMLKVEDAADGDIFVEATEYTTVALGWEKLTFDFAMPSNGNLDYSNTYDKKSIFFNFGHQPTQDQTFYWDDVTFVELDEDPDGPTDPEQPPTEPPAEGEQIILFNDAANPAWPAWDCCGGSTPTVITDPDPDYGAVTEFSINGATVVGFSARSDHGAIGGAPIDVSAWSQTGTVSFDLKLTTEAGADSWKFKVESANGTAAELDFNEAPELNVWKRYSFNLSDLANAGLNLAEIDLVMMFPAWGSGIGSTYLVDNVVFSSVGATEPEAPEGLPPLDVPGNLISNGDFETGNLDPWFQSGAGTVYVENGVAVTATNNGGESRIKQQGIGAGELFANQEVTLTFSVKGNTTDGGVVNGIVHTESAAGVSATELITIPAVTDEWVEHSYTFTIGNDPQWGLSVTLGGVCGAVVGCTANAQFDNISLVASSSGQPPVDPEQPPVDPELPPVEVPGNLLINGTFETGTLDPWFQTGGGTVSIVNNAARTSAVAGNEARIKQQKIGQGSLTANQSVTLTFSVKGSSANGSVVNGIVHTEAPSGVSGTEVINIPAITNEWVEHSFTFNIGSDPEWGLGLTLGAVCGAVSGCQATADFDNISLIAN